MSSSKIDLSLDEIIKKSRRGGRGAAANRRGGKRGGRVGVNVRSVRGRGRPSIGAKAIQAQARTLRSSAASSDMLNRRRALQIVKKALLGRKMQARKVQRPSLNVKNVALRGGVRRTRGASRRPRGVGSGVRARLGWSRGRAGLQNRAVKGRGTVGQMQSDLIAASPRRSEPVQSRRGRWRNLSTVPSQSNPRGQWGSPRRRGRGQWQVRSRAGLQTRGRGRGRGRGQGSASALGVKQRLGARGGRRQNFEVTTSPAFRSRRGRGRPFRGTAGVGVRASFSQNETGTTLNERFGGLGNVNIRGGRGRKIYL